MAIDYTQAAGQVRLLISDVDESNFTIDDDMVSGFLAMYGLTSTQTGASRPSLYRAAAEALGTIATSEALISKVLRTGDGLQTDGAKLAETLLGQADRLRKRADREESEDGTLESFWGVAEFKPDDHAPEAAEAHAGWWY